MSITKLVEKFINSDCEIILDKEFCYYPEDEIITITLAEDPATNISWKEYLKKNFDFDLTVENVFTMSILHELGHHYTLSYFSDEQWEKENKIKEDIIEKMEDENAHACRMEYFNLPTEKLATAWAVEYYKMNKIKMKKWNHRLNCSMKHYFKNHFEPNISLLTKF